MISQLETPVYILNFTVYESDLKIALAPICGIRSGRIAGHEIIDLIVSIVLHYDREVVSGANDTFDNFVGKLGQIAGKDMLLSKTCYSLRLYGIQIRFQNCFGFNVW